MINTMSDLGETYPKTSCGCPDCMEKHADKKPQKHYPRESFTTDQMPSLQGLTVGDKVKIVLEAEVCSVSEGEEYPNPGESEDEVKKKTRISLRLKHGTSEKVNNAPKQTETDPGTIKADQRQKEKDFNEDLGLDNEEKTV